MTTPDQPEPTPTPPTPAPAAPQGGGPTPAFGEPAAPRPARRPWHRAPWAIGVAGLVIGLILGVGATALVMADDGDTAQTAAEPGSPVATDGEGGDDEADNTDGEGEGEGDATATTAGGTVVPDVCIDVLDQAEAALDLLNEGLSALSRLELARVTELLDRVEDLRAGTADQVQACRDAAAARN